MHCSSKLRSKRICFGCMAKFDLRIGIGSITAGLLFLVSGSLQAGAFALVSNGAAQSVIVLGAEAGPLTHLAAAELQSYFEKLTGARVAQTSDPDSVEA